LADRKAVMLLNDVMRLFPSGRVLLVFLQVSWPGSSEYAMVLRFNQFVSLITEGKLVCL
jgi:hypothetical protein